MSQWEMRELSFVSIDYDILSIYIIRMEKIIETFIDIVRFYLKYMIEIEWFFLYSIEIFLNS